MKTLRLRQALLGAVIASALLSTTACFGHRRRGQSQESHLAEVIQVEYDFVRSCCNPANALPFPLGQVTITNKNAAGSNEPAVRVEVSTGASLRADATTLEVAAGETKTVNVDVTGCAYDSDVVTLALGYGDERRVDTLPARNLCSPALPLFVAMNLLILPQLIAPYFIPAFLVTPVGRMVLHSARGVPACVPLLRYTEIAAIGAFVMVMTLAQLQAAFGELAVSGIGQAHFPPGLGANGYTLVAERPLPMPEGGYHAVFFATDGEIPLNDPARRYQYAFVFDADGRPENDYRPAVDFPNDFFQGTDRWYEVSYAPADGWKLRCKRVDAGNRITEVASAGRVVIVKSGMFLLVPQNEFAVERPRYRVTAFGHEGDYGLRPPYAWSGDTEPPVSEGLRAF